MEDKGNYKGYRVRRLGEPRKKSKEIRVSSWDKEKIKIKCIKGGKAWALTEGKVYEVIETDLISNNDDEIWKRAHHRYDKQGMIGSYGHQMPWYFKIINDKGNKRSYPQKLFKLDAKQENQE